MKKISVKGRDFIDIEGKPVILNGINIVCKSPNQGYIFELTDFDWKRLKNWEVNVVRFGIHWSGLEPLPGVIDTAYLDAIEKEVRKFEAHDIPVYLDMHQDLYSMAYSNGAPLWATFSEGPHIKKGEWYNSYHMSPAVQTAEDAFWENRSASDGIGLQDHLANTWKTVAERFADDPNVIGYDLLNEPIQGSPCREVGHVLIQALADWQSEVQNREVTWHEAFELYWDQPAYHKCLEGLSAEKCLELENRAFYLTEEFDTKDLQPFYEKVAAAIREVDKESIIFVCNSNQTNNGTASALKPLIVNGERDPYQVFAAHAYDLICDAPNQNAYKQERINAMLDQHFAVALKYEWPMLVGEWGALPRESFTSLKKYRDTRKKMAELGVSQTYWDYGPSTAPFFLDEYFSKE